MSKTFDEDLDEVDYEFKDELKIRKVLEAHTDWNYEFTKSDQYEYDLTIYQWDDEPRTPDDQEVLGYVELERSRRDKEHSWVMGSVPDSWPFLSFLMRKVREYDRRSRTWQGLKNDYGRTVYLKFNHAMTNCFAAPVTSINRDGVRTKRSDGGYNSTYLRLNKDHADVRYGIETCTEFISDYLNEQEQGQTDLSTWDRR